MKTRITLLILRLLGLQPQLEVRTHPEGRARVGRLHYMGPDLEAAEEAVLALPRDVQCDLCIRATLQATTGSAESPELRALYAAAQQEPLLEIREGKPVLFIEEVQPIRAPLIVSGDLPAKLEL